AGARPVLDRDRGAPAHEPPFRDAPDSRGAAGPRGISVEARLQRGLRPDGGDREWSPRRPRAVVARHAASARRWPLGLPDPVRAAVRDRGRDVGGPAQHHRRPRPRAATVVTDRLLEAALDAARTAGTIALPYFPTHAPA